MTCDGQRERISGNNVVTYLMDKGKVSAIAHAAQ